MRASVDIGIGQALSVVSEWGQQAERGEIPPEDLPTREELLKAMVGLKKGEYAINAGVCRLLGIAYGINIAAAQQVATGSC